MRKLRQDIGSDGVFFQDLYFPYIEKELQTELWVYWPGIAYLGYGRGAIEEIGAIRVRVVSGSNFEYGMEWSGCIDRYMLCRLRKIIL